jgi:GNAT superfamily N-acetyltransferase
MALDISATTKRLGGPATEIQPILLDHWLLLGPRSRQLRFLSPVRDEWLANFSRTVRPDITLGVFADSVLRGTLEVHFLGNGHAEIGLSIQDDYQGLGLGRAIFERGLREAAAAGIRTADLFFARDNTGVAHLVKAAGGTIRYCGSEAEASINLSGFAPH